MRRGNNKGINVVGAARECERHTHKDAGLVGHENTDNVSVIDFHNKVPFMISLNPYPYEGEGSG
jgi:hypothetical protein